MATRALPADVLIDLSDTLAPGFDLPTYLGVLAGHCARFADADATGILIADSDGSPHTVDARPGDPRRAALRDLQCLAGPGALACATGVPEGGPVTRWPDFAHTATAAGFHHAHGIPMRLRGTPIGAVCLYRVEDRAFTADELSAAQSLADMAAIGITTERAVRQRQTLADQLQSALDSRVVIEQAKGVLAERKGIRLTESFQELRRLARNHNLKIAQVAEEVVRSALPLVLR
ncbi:GAF and ANTAR domain-containing protein [Actinokineospora inagensis]|uniref:GAF and ANTAR domain-containing protein n=1 Tax=Actinokineospora inagensis TaxID=103730 RepID=UPI00040F051A|nr:GAF and ANTAR domain-containing protein [Actinokineospora inagensis]